nr:MAG TPA_asm: hypothetical protein [Bacteriophage sp.]DAL91840.1 MAG TPA: hypothetical protein [Caudoviricetes sp.]
MLLTCCLSARRWRWQALLHRGFDVANVLHVGQYRSDVPQTPSQQGFEPF